MRNRRPGVDRSLAVVGVAALGMLASACEKAGAAAERTAAQNAIKADEKKWNEEIRSKNLEAILAHYADDAYLADTKPAVSGLPQIRKRAADDFASAAADRCEFSFASDKIDVAASGDLAYARGRVRQKCTDPATGEIVRDGGSYVLVYKKQKDGRWKVVEDVSAVDLTNFEQRLKQAMETEAQGLIQKLESRLQRQQ